MQLFTVSLYQEGVEFSTDILEEPEVMPFTKHFERQGFEVRSEPAFPLTPTPTQPHLEHYHA